MKTMVTLSALTLSIILAMQVNAMPFGKGQCNSEQHATNLLAQFDGDGDGAITLDELQQVRTAHFVTIDTDGSGDLTEAEMQVYGDAMHQTRMQERFAATDTNADGVLSLEELQAVRGERASYHFNVLDSNADGALTLEEMTTFVDAGRSNNTGKSSFHFQRLDTDSSGTLSQEEFMYNVPLFDRFDSDEDGIITQEEITSQSCQGHGKGRGHGHH